MARTEAIDSSRLEAFVELPFALHASDPLWVPPLRQVVTGELLSPRLERQLFLHGEEGRIAALLHPQLPFGQLGYFEAATEDAARSLIAAGLEWLRGRGVKQAVGPMNGAAHRLHRFLVGGFERKPFLFEPRNPPEHPRWFESAGFAPVAKWWTYEAPRPWIEELRALLAPGVLRAKRTGHEIVPLEGPEAVPRIHALLDSVWKGHVGYASLDREEFVEVFAGVLALMSKRTLGTVADASGHDLGCAFMYPDWVGEVRALAGDASGWGRWLGGARPAPRRMVLHTVAFAEKARRSGAPFMILDLGLQHLLEDGYDELVVALVTEDWKLFARSLEPTRTYALYGRAL
jgi:hypothetical protein